MSISKKSLGRRAAAVSMSLVAAASLAGCSGSSSSSSGDQP